MLKEIKTRYAGKCATCGREIKEGWNIFFDPDTKKVYCKPCGATMGGAESSEQVLSEAEITQLPEDMQTRLRDAGMVKEPTPEENIAVLLDTLCTDIDAVREATLNRLDTISGGVAALIEATGSLADKVDSGFSAINKPTKKTD